MIGRLTVFVTVLVIGLFMTLAWPSQAHASKCEAGTVFNPITKVRWTCIFPITVGGIRVGSFDKLDKALDAQSASKPLCACRKGIQFWFGVKVSYWSPNRMVDVVTEPGCMMRSEEHTSELQSLMRISYAVFCLKKKKIT